MVSLRWAQEYYLRNPICKDKGESAALAYFMTSSSCARRQLLLVLVSLFLTGATSAQSVNDVEIVPRAEAEKTASSDGNLEAHLKPLRVDVDLVLVPVTVTDPHGSPAMDLVKDDFRLFEGDAEQKIGYFYSEDAPVSVGLIVDLSSSMGNKLDRVRQAATEFFNNADPQDDYFVITFADRVKVLANTTQSTATIQAKLAEAKAKGNTALADAIYAGIVKLRSAQYRRRALVIISDGGDNMSRHGLRQVKNMAKEADAEIYAIDVCDAPGLLFTKKLEERFGRQWLTQVTEQTGGRTLVVDNAEKIPGAASQISSEIRNQYVLGFRPTSGIHDGKWRKLKVRITRPSEPIPYQVYYRTGYMARKQDD